MSIRKLFASTAPTNSARLIICSLLALLLSACASTPQPTGSAQPQESAATHPQDPFENVNRRIFAFNNKVDSWVLKPVAQAYDSVTPEPVQTGVSNFFGNLTEVRNTLNSALQWKWADAAHSSGRFLINSTVGLAGLFDVAAKAGLAKQDGEDFGQTLAVWGIDSGPYLMLPLLGPATVRDGVGKPVDTLTHPLYYVDDSAWKYGLTALDIIDNRAGLLEVESLLSGDGYTLMRDYYLQNREYLINDGVVEDDFGGGDYGGDAYYEDSYDY